MTEIIAALIAMFGTVVAAVLPRWLKKRSEQSVPVAGKRVPLATVLVVAVFVLVGAWGAHDRSREFASATQISFFLGVTGVAASLLGWSALTWRQAFGVYVGYIIAIIAGLFLLWGILIKRPDYDYLNEYALASTIGVGWSLWLFWRTHVLDEVARQRAQRAETNES